MKHVKDGVKTEGIQPQLLDAILICTAVYIHAGQQITVTSICDGVHSKNSLHYKGLAVDLRTRDLKGITANQLAVRLRKALGNEYDVVVEKDHIHVEYDPK